MSILLCFVLWAEAPQAFRSMGEALESELQSLKALQELKYFNKDEVDKYEQELQYCFETGYLLDEAIKEKSPEAQNLKPKYLSKLRGRQRASRHWQRIYAKALNESMESADRELFEFLVSNPLAPLERPSFKRRTLAFYETFREEHTIAAMEVIREDLRLEEQSAAFLSTERAAFKKDQQVLAQEAVEQSNLPVLVSTKRENGIFTFYAQNRNIYPVTLTLELPSIRNFTPSDRLPKIIELAPGSKQKVLSLEVDDRRKKASFTSRYSWVMGRLSARHSDPLYALPFAAGSRVFVSQGVDGGITHKGLTRFAVDFQCPVGTKIYAARGGRVIAAESSHNKGGFDKSFGDQANYIVIEHDDHTLGKYYHLKQYGVMVRVGETVHTGQFIGYSGNTGYSSGPHLHFSVSSVDPASKNLPITLPFRFKTAQGIINTPKTRDVYITAKVR